MAYSLKSKYQCYKADTATIAKWLASTANAYGYGLGDNASLKIVSSPGGRLKGKARKAAKEAILREKMNKAKVTSSGTIAGERQTHHIKIKDFEPMAEFLSKVDDLELPPAFGTTLDRVIRVRNEFANQLYATREVDDDAAESHSYFVQVLEKVRAHLSKHFVEKPKVPNPRINGQSEKKLRENDNILHNMFSVLEVYAPSAEAESAPTLTPTYQPKVEDNIEYVVEEADDIGAIEFAFAALLKDLADLRAEVLSLWADYQCGRRELATVAAAIHVSSEMARAIENDVTMLIAKGGGAHKLAFSWVSKVAFWAGIDMEQKTKSAGPYNMEAYELAKSCFFNTLEIFQVWRACTGGADAFPACTVEFPPQTFEIDDTASPNLIQLTRDAAAICDMLPDLSTLATIFRGKMGLVTDELVAGLWDIAQSETKEAPL
ncbi:hypothetical protein VHEMI04644 [[Torrubiella] hemipterigena]|uniref:DUF6604 domain-containing protein n=1 Tax=[Torrubiella] hemipterigena TaxID=1531966 RepID=A0A0A1TGU1_9HYPO|nr:hypothetical protein VHEMI04644 [[Torrubiella] hemipterigena]